MIDIRKEPMIHCLRINVELLTVEGDQRLAKMPFLKDADNYITI